MRLAPIFASSLAVSLSCVALSARANVTEPNGLVVPIDSSSSGETQLYTLFQQRGEAITQATWQADAQQMPNAFSPLCGFTATYVLNQAGSHFGLAWYNEVGQPPPASDLHILVQAGSPVGTMFNGTSIKSDPNYMGGLVGFALMGGETHYTNDAYDTLCTACNPQGHWITALMYASTVTPNAYYICFEDGGTSAGGWNNDGDFNDDVFFLTGISCSGGDQPCDTGKPGICAAGLTQCTAMGTTCQQLQQPAAMETCNGIDDDCNGLVDDGAPCPAGEVCEKGTCVQSCQGGEFNCPPGLVCDNTGHCIDPKCVNVTCPAGQVCIAGTCKGPCDGVTCPYPQVCRVGVCLDPCAGVTCATGQVCDDGVCVQSCDCQPCPSGKGCDAMSGLCVDPACINKPACTGTTHCEGGTCVDDCMGAVCPTGETCKAGNCVAAPSGTGGSSTTGVVFGAGGGTQSSGTQSGGTQSGGTQSGGAGGAGGGFGSGGGSSGTSSKCGCRVPGESEGDLGSNGLALAGLALAVAGMRRRRAR